MLVHLYPSTDQERSMYVTSGNETELCRSAGMHVMRSSWNDQRPIGLGNRHRVCKGSVAIQFVSLFGTTWFPTHHLRELTKFCL
jgi:hypothetical protein